MKPRFRVRDVARQTGWSRRDAWWLVRRQRGLSLVTQAANVAAIRRTGVCACRVRREFREATRG